MNHRRKLIAALGTGALAAQFGAFAQPAKPAERIWRVGFLAPQARPADIAAHFYGGFPQGMRERGYLEGKTLLIDWRFADGDFARLPNLAMELAQAKPDVIVAAGPQAVGAAKKATNTIPIVMATTGDPVGSGFIASLARPGGNITGTSTNTVEVAPKLLEMLLDMAPGLTRVSYLMNPANQTHALVLPGLEAAAQKTRTKFLVAKAGNAEEIGQAFAMMKREKAGAVIVLADPVFSPQVRMIGELAIKHRMLSISGGREFVDAGCLMSYGASFADSTRRAAYYADRIFKGTKPADLPVEQPTKYELFINGKTAKALALKIPHSLLITAEKVIE